MRASFRNIRRRPVHALLFVSVLALGLSATVTVFTYINAYDEPLPGANANQLIQVFAVENEETFGNLSFLDFSDYARAASGSFEGLAAVQSSAAASVRHETMTEVALVEAVSGDFFPVLGLRTSVGRALEPDDDRPGAEPVAVLSHGWWRRSFGGDARVIGQTVYLNNRPHTVVGVMAPDFLGTLAAFRPDVWIPFEPYRARYTNWDAQAKNRDRPLVRVYGRLRPGVDAGQALDELAGVALGLDSVYPAREPRQLRLATPTWIDPRTRRSEVPTVRVMMAAAVGLLVLVSANVTNLLVVVTAGRRREMAMRVALGASRGRLLGEIMLENVWLSVMAGGVSLAIAGPASRHLGSYFARPSVWGANVAREPAIDLTVLAFAVVVSLLSALVAVGLPAWRASRQDLVRSLKGDAMVWRRTATRKPWTRGLLDARITLVAMQVAIAVVLVVVAGLVLRTLTTASRVNPGFVYDRLVASYISTSSTRVTEEERDRFFRNVADGLTAEPWVRAATVADNAPLSPHASALLRPEGLAEAEPIVYSKVLPGFFNVLGIEVVRGRGFFDTDGAESRGVAVVNEALAERFFPDTEPIGRQIWWPDAPGGSDRVFEVVGVVGDVRAQDFLGSAEPVVYFSYPQHPYSPGSALLVSTTIDPAASIPMLERWLREREPFIAIVNILPYSDVVRGFVYRQRMNAELFSTLAFLGLALAAVGIFGVLSVIANQRTREIGIRMALGARRSAISRLMIRQVLAPVVLGLGAGGLMALAASGLVRSLLYGVEPSDPWALTGSVSLLVGVAILAAYLPARRAAAVDPAVVLRRE